jgi:hypothetical protein
MLKKTMTYKNFLDEEVTEDFYFHFTKAELIKLEVSEKGGLTEMLQKIAKEEDGKKIIEMFEKIILMAYGERSADGREFTKSDAIRTRFASTQAYSDLFMSLALDAGVAAEFMNSVIPADLAAEVAKEQAVIAQPQDYKKKDPTVLKQGGKK